MSYLLSLNVPDHQAMTDLRRHLENGAATPSNINALATAKALEKFFFTYGERISFNDEKIETPNDYESSIPNPNPDNIDPKAESLLETTEAEVIKSQANRLTSVDIEHTVGSMTTRVSYWFATPPITPEITVSVPESNADFSSHINKSVAETFSRPYSPSQDHGNYKGIGHKKAMEIADHPTNYNRAALEEALRTLSRHILTNPRASNWSPEMKEVYALLVADDDGIRKDMVSLNKEIYRLNEEITKLAK